MKSGRTSALAGLVVVLALGLWYALQIKSQRNGDSCKSAKRFKAMDFTAIITDTVFTVSEKLIYVQTLEQEESVLNLSHDSNHVYRSMSLGDTLQKEFGSTHLKIRNHKKFKQLTPDFHCE